MELILSDLYRYEGRNDIKAFIHSYAINEGFRFSVWLRVCSVARRNKLTKVLVLPWSRLIYKHYKYKYGYDIPYAIDIGPGLRLFHIGGIVFCPEKCGKNVSISQNTTVGMTIHEGQKEYPILGDNVYIAPGAMVIGGIHVGNDVAIGSNSVLTKSVDDHSVIVGIPAKIISYKGARDYVSNRI